MKYKCSGCDFESEKEFNVNRHINGTKSKCTNSKVIQEQTEIAKLLERIKVLEIENALLKTMKPTVVNNTINITNNIVVNFYDTKYDCLPIQPIIDMIKQESKLIEIASHYSKYIFFDKKFPERNNLVVRDSSRGVIEIFQDGKWIIVDKVKFLDFFTQGYFDNLDEIAKNLKTDEKLFRHAHYSRVEHNDGQFLKDLLKEIRGHTNSYYNKKLKITN